MDEQNRLAAVWSWLSPVLARDVRCRDVAQGREVDGRSSTHHFFTTLLTHSFDRIQTQLLAIHRNQNAILLELRFNGRHCGNFVGIPPTGRLVSLLLTVRFGVRNGRIHHINLNYDAADLLQQLGFSFSNG